MLAYLAGEAARVEHNILMAGVNSGKRRQIDIRVSGALFGLGNATMIVACERYRKPIDVNHVGAPRRRNGPRGTTKRNRGRRRHAQPRMAGSHPGGDPSGLKVLAAEDDVPAELDLLVAQLGSSVAREKLDVISPDDWPTQRLFPRW